MTTTPVPNRRVDARSLSERLTAAGAPRILDVRTPAEFESAHIPGSYNVPLDTLEEHRTELSSHLDEDVALVCRTGARADQAEQALATAGLPGLRVLDGGITGWENAGAPLNRGRETWDLERQVRFAAGSLVALGVLGSTRYAPMKWLSGAVGGGLVFAAVSNTCAMGMALSTLPWNRAATAQDVGDVLDSLRPER